MTDVSDVPGPKGATLDDVLDVVARTNRGILALEKTIASLVNLVTTFFTILFLYLWVKG